MTKNQQQVIVLYGSSIIGLLIGVLASVINTRALVPEFYGDVRYVQNIISFVSSLLLLGYFVSGSRLLAIARDENQKRGLRGAMCVILMITICIVTLVMTALWLYFKIEGNVQLSKVFLASIPVCGNVLMLNYVNTVFQGDNHIGRIAAGRVIPTGVYCIVSYFIFKYYGATSSRMLLMFNGIAVLALSGIIISAGPSFSNIHHYFDILKEENSRYGFDVYLGSLITVSSGYIAGITLGWFCKDNTSVGLYTLALTLATPLTMLPSIIGTTFFQRFANQDKINKNILYGSVGLTVISFILFVAFIKVVVNFLYDDGYSQVSNYASFLAIGTSMHGLGDMINRFLGAHGKGKMLRNSSMLSGFVTLVGSFLLVYFWNIEGAIVTKILSSFIYLLSMVYYYLKFRQSAIKETDEGR